METAARSAATPPPRAPTSPSLPTPRLLLASICLPAAALAGRLPLELDAFSALDSIYLAANSLSGPMPLELGKAPSLSALNLVGNALSSALPASTWNLCDRVTELRLHGNALAGAIPAPAGPNTTCDRLRVLDLSANRFSGDFPSFITAFRGLQRLDLTSNRLSGPIPNALAPEIRWKEELAQRSWRRKIREGHTAWKPFSLSIINYSLGMLSRSRTRSNSLHPQSWNWDSLLRPHTPFGKAQGC